MPVSKRAASMQPYWKSDCGCAVVYVGDCRKVTPHMEPEQFYAVVTDPPYELTSKHGQRIPQYGNGRGAQEEKSRRGNTGGFMGLKWDGSGVAFDPKTWEAVLRVAKPGTHLLSFGGTRTWHRMTCAIEDGGFSIRDTLMWVYGSGFPKSHNVSKAIDKALGAQREKVKTPMGVTGNKYAKKLGDDRPWMQNAAENGYHEHDGDEPVTEEAKQWQGWGTCLKPAYEPIVLARKPLGGTVAQCVMKNGTGGLNIDGCRVLMSADDAEIINSMGGYGVAGWKQKEPGNALHMSVDQYISSQSKAHEGGRWPANLIHDGSEEVVELFPDGVARFFYTAKADDSDRPHGKGATAHPTVKPLDLMRYLVRLVCVQGGTVLDPFMGSGSTGCASIAEGMRFVGIEQSQEYADLAVGRLRLALQGKGEQETPPPPKKLRG